MYIGTPLQMAPPSLHIPYATHLPVMEHRETESLSLCVCTQVSLKAKRINGRNERFDCVEGGAWDGCVLGHMTSSPCQHSVDRGHTIGWSLHLHKIVGLHQARSSLVCVCVCVCICRYLVLIEVMSP